MNRRSFIKSVLASAIAPYVVTAAGVLMPVRKLLVPDLLVPLPSSWVASGDTWIQNISMCGETSGGFSHWWCAGSPGQILIRQGNRVEVSFLDHGAAEVTVYRDGQGELSRRFALSGGENVVEASIQVQSHGGNARMLTFNREGWQGEFPRNPRNLIHKNPDDSDV